MLNKITLDASEWHPFRTLSKIHGGIITMDSSSVVWTADVHRYAWRPIADEPVNPCTRQHIVTSTASPMRNVCCNDQHHRMARRSLPTFSHSRPLYIILLYSAFEYAVEVIICFVLSIRPINAMISVGMMNFRETMHLFSYSQSKWSVVDSTTPNPPHPTNTQPCSEWRCWWKLGCC